MSEQSNQTKFGEQQFSEEERGTIRKLLEQKLGKEHISYREGPGKVAYLETNKAIQLANDIFGYTGWASSVVNLSVDYLEEKSGKFSAGVSAIVRISLKDGTHHEDIGYGTADNRGSKAQALDLAKKSAVSDGLKRALRLFGNSLGNSLYDREHLKKVKNPAPVLVPPPKQEPNQQRNISYANNGPNANYGPAIGQPQFPNNTGFVNTQQSIDNLQDQFLDFIDVPFDNPIMPNNSGHSNNM